jgi:hypothetical protein
MAVVTLDIPKFRAIFPEFSDVTDVQLQFLFDEATDYLNNSEYSVVPEYAKRERLLYLLMAHLAWIRYGDAKGNGGSGFVGRISSATEGSVSVGSELGAMSVGTAWYTQSPYGLAFWQATKVYRMAKWYPGCPYRYVRQDYT